MFLGLGVTCDGIPFPVFLCLLVFCCCCCFFYGWEHQGKYYRVQVLSCNINNVWKSLVDIASLSSIPHRFLLFRRTSGIQWWSSPVGKLGSKAKWHKVSKGLMPHFFLSPLTSARIFFLLVDYQNQSHFASLRALIWERLTLLDHQFLYWVPCLFRFQSPWAGFFFLTRSRLIPKQVHKQRLVPFVVLVLSALRLFSRLSCRKINEYILYNISFHQGVNEESGQKGKGEGPMG